MAISSGFFNSKNDRYYDARQMSSIFDGIICDGIFQHLGTAMVVKEADGMMITVGSGRAWFDHTWTLNDAPLPLTVSPSEVILDRIDAVILDVNNSIDVRDNDVFIVKGTPAANPNKPTMIKTNDHCQYPLAYVSVKAGATSIRQADIENRVGTTDAPFITAPLEKIEIDDLVAQWGDQWVVWFNNMRNSSEELYEEAAEHLRKLLAFQWEQKLYRDEAEQFALSSKNNAEEIQRLLSEFRQGPQWYIDPTSGLYTPLQTILFNLYGLFCVDAFTAKEYDELGLTAAAYDQAQLTALQYDTSGKKYL